MLDNEKDKKVERKKKETEMTWRKSWVVGWAERGTSETSVGEEGQIKLKWLKISAF